MDEEKNNNNTDREVKGISLENNVITLKVNLNGLTANQVYFYLKDLPEGATIEGTKSENGADATKKKVFVRAKAGTYEFTIKTDKGSVKVTVNVVDVTMPTLVAFKTLRAEEVTAITDTAIQYNTDDVVKSVKTSPSAKTFAGNVNLMKTSEDGGKYYKVRLEIKNCAASDVRAVNKDTLKEYKVETIEGAPNEVYVYLDANEAKTKLVLKHKDATAEQVKEATATEVTFESTSSIWLKLTGSSVTPRCKNTGTLTIDSVNNQVINVGVDFDNLKPITFTVKDGKINPEEVVTDTIKGEKWLALSLKLTDDASGDVNAIYTEDNDDTKFILDKTPSSSNTNRIVWIRAEKEGTVKFTLKYNLADNKVEELPITVNLHDITDPLVEAVTTSTAGIINAKVDDTVANKGKLITVDSYKYGMDATVARKETETSKTTTTGRWYSLELKTNVDVSSLVYAKDGKWAEIPEDMISNGKIVVWLNADKTDDLATGAGAKVITLANRYTVKVGEAVANKKVEITVKRTEKSRLEIWTTSSKNKMIYSNMLNLASDLNLDGRQVENLKEQIEGHAVESTLQDNLTASKKHIESVYNADKNLNTLTYNLSYFKDIKVDNAKGKWAVVYFCCRDSEDITGNDIPGALYVDKLNASRLLTTSTYKGGMTGNETWDLVPIWINLSAPELAKYVKDVDETSAEALEIKLSTTNPEEHNSIFVTFENTSAAQEIEHVEKATGSFNSQEYKNADTNTKKELAKKLMSNPGDNDAEGYANTLINAMEILEKGSISEPRVVDDTVYLTVKADLSEFAAKAKSSKDNHVRIPLKLDVSMLGAKDGTKLNIWSRQSEDWSSTYDDNRDFDGNYLDFVVNFTDNSKYQETGNGTTKEVDNFTNSKSVTKTFIITTLSSAQSIDCSSQPNNCDKEADIIKGLREKNANYVKYVIDFVEG